MYRIVAIVTGPELVIIIVSFFINLSLETINRSKRIPFTFVSAFSLFSVFSGRFWLEFRTF